MKPSDQPAPEETALNTSVGTAAKSAAKSAARTAAETAAETAYDLVPYPSYPYGLTHPEHLYAIGKLFGLNVPQPDKARVLEIGCAAGGNLLPLAVHYPEARLIGFDLSAKQIGEAVAAQQALKLKNVQFLACGVERFDDQPQISSEQQFDYILCHGVFSWVDESTQRSILELIRKRLTPFGIAYVSYNTLPGWHLRGMVREMMRYHARGHQGAAQQVRQARLLLDFLARATTGSKQPFAQLLQQEAELLAKQSDSYLFHEQLEEHNRPMYFEAFIGMAKTVELQYLGEAQLPSMWLGNLATSVRETLERLTPDVEQREQYADFVVNRTFRHTLLCRQEQAINRRIDAERLAGAYFATELLPVGKTSATAVTTGEQGVSHSHSQDPAAHPGDRYSTPSGTEFQVHDPVLRGVVAHLSAERPRSLSFEQLLGGVRQRLGWSGVAGAEQVHAIRERLAGNLGLLLFKGLITIRRHPSRFATEAGEYPRVTPLAAWQAEHQPFVTSLRHEPVVLSPVARLLATKLDGRIARTQLATLLEAGIADGRLVPPVSSDEQAYDLLEAADTGLRELIMRCLIVADQPIKT